MFRSVGQPNTTAHIFCNVAWGTSLGGLALLAEERRRRVALAQKIIENGKRLQGYKAYTGLATLSAFDLGEEWDTGLPNLQDGEAKREPESHTLTNQEWRSRRRTHRNIPIAEGTGLSLEEVLSISGDRTDLPFLRYLKSSVFAPNRKPTHQQSRPLHKLELEEAKEEDTQTISHELETHTTLELLPEATSNPPASKHGPRHRYALQLQSIVGDYVNDCLCSNNSEVRAAGFRELAAFFDRPRISNAPELKRAIATAFEAPESAIPGSVAEQARSLICASMEWSSTTQPQPQKSSEPRQFSGVRTVKTTRLFSTAQGLPMEEQLLAENIDTSLSAGLLDDAFFAFLTMCDELAQPIGRTTRAAIRKLTSAYKKAGLFSIVHEIQQQLLSVFKEWRLVYHDIRWLMDQRLPETNVEFVQKLVQTFLGFERMKPDSLVHLSVRMVDWFVDNDHIDHGVALFVTLFSKDNIGHVNEEVEVLASKLYEICNSRGYYEQAGILLTQMIAKNIPMAWSAVTAQKLVGSLIQGGLNVDAADLYFASSGCWDNLAPPTEFIEAISAACPLFADIVYDKLRTQLHSLHFEKNYSQIVRLSKLISDTARLGSELEVIVYHAYALAGPILDASRVIERLSKAQIPLWSNIIHDSHSALINRSWKQTRNFELVQDLFRQINALGYQQSRSVKTFNAIILACVEAGKPGEAQIYFDQMLTEARIVPNLYSWSNLMLAKAVSKDWTALEDVFEKAQEQYILPRTGPYDGTFFDKSFAAFCNHHNAEECVDYIISLTGQNRMSITKTASNCVVDLSIKAENIDLLTRWVSHMHLQGYEVEVGKESVSRILQRIMQSKRLRLHPILVEAHHLHETGKDVALPQLLDRLNAAIIQQTPGMQHSKRSHATNRESRRSTERGMLRALANKKPEEALRLYKESLEYGLPKQQLDLELAVRATLNADQESSDAAAQLIEDAKVAGLNTDRANTPLILHQLRNKRLTYHEAHHIAFEYYNSVDEPRIPLHHHVTVALARNLNDHGNSAAALRLLKSASDSEWGQAKPFDITVLTMTLRLLIKQQQTDGVAWVVQTVLDRNLRIDKIFIHTLHEGLRRAKPVHEGPESGFEGAQGEVRQFLEALQAHLMTCRERRAQQRAKTMVFAKDTVNLLRKRQDQSLLERRTSAVDAPSDRI